ncbi:MAG: gluconokinase, partial [Acidobacteria bacterium]|nr:gluconokinase [Acidobacteriota bacterium]
ETLNEARSARGDAAVSHQGAGEITEREARTPLVLGIDVGTSSVRAALYDGRGREVAGTQARVARSFRTTRDGGAEDDAEDIVGQVEAVIDGVLARTSSTRVEAFALACFWHSLVGVDGEGRALTPVYGWADTRAAREVEELRRRFDERETHARTGCRFHPGYWPAKLLRLRRNSPDAWRSVARWVSPAEFITHRFTGEWAASVSMASGTGLLNQRLCEWDAGMLDGVGVSPEQLPSLAPAGWAASLEERYARRWPQLRGARLFPAVGDGAANNVGVGCVGRDALALMVGTSGAMRVMWEGEPPGELPPALWCYRADHSRVLVGGALSDGGGLRVWMRESLSLGVEAEALEQELASMEPDSHGLTILPFWAGERSTNWSEHARGAILGLTMHTRPVDILRASLEAIAYRFALIAEALDCFAPGAEIRASGGALTASPAWAQILSDVLNRPVKLTQAREASILGAVLLALEASGAVENLASLSQPSFGDTYTPEPSRRERYREGLDRQQQAYHAIVGQRA